MRALRLGEHRNRAGFDDDVGLAALGLGKVQDGAARDDAVGDDPVERAAGYLFGAFWAIAGGQPRLCAARPQTFVEKG